MTVSQGIVPLSHSSAVPVKAAGVNPLDNMITRGEVKLVVPYAFPLVMGNELAGVVEVVGAGVTAFAPGDRVYGRLPLGKIGAFAELCAVDAGALAKIPDYLSFEEAAAVPLAALTAMQAFDLLDAKPGDTVFLSGGTRVSLKGMPNRAFAVRAGFGTFKQMLFGVAGKKYDAMAKRRGQTYHFMFVHADGKQLQEISDLFAQLQIRPSVDAVFPLSEADAALKKIASGGSRGKTILTMQ